ncbi:hypothetical protein AIOL_004767 [Candidatus Rhodobacter oscarellae]|uniref:Uncharacterized protein n=1 Tax=Candidatus Rhodobacter oscarellae TaxID=1675527 RepID=A0A0J9H247_9RHOB|nr:hypothetical protein AIOL_004767 [Candidatus Rhodobacter lobularis]
MGWSFDTFQVINLLSYRQNNEHGQKFFISPGFWGARHCLYSISECKLLVQELVILARMMRLFESVRSNVH